MIAPISAVFDCNVLLQAMSRPDGPAGHCFNSVIAGSVQLHISRFVLAELADVTSRPEVAAKLRLTPLDCQAVPRSSLQLRQTG